MQDQSYKSPVHFKPERGVLADTIPFFWKGEYHIFYLRGGIGKVPWEHIVSKDLVHWDELPTALVPGGAEDGPDGEHMFTGSVIEKDGTFHIFYTGWNPRNPKGREFIMHATSPDLITWAKHPQDIIGPDGAHYSDHLDRDFRDAYVFWNEEEKQYWMLLCANEAATKRGCTGLAVSKDLKEWKQEPPLLEADFQECPDFFTINGVHYLIGGDHYSYAKKSRGPYMKPPVNNVIDRDGIYAGKRMFDGKRHVWTGWVWETENKKDAPAGIWGGAQCVPRELYALKEGQLGSRPVPEAEKFFSRTVLNLKSKPQLRKTPYYLNVPSDFMLESRINISPESEFMFYIRSQESGEGYYLKIIPGKQAAAIGSVDRAGKPFEWQRGVEIDASKPVGIKIFSRGTILECFINDAFAFTRRAYNFPSGRLNLCVTAGSASVDTLTVKTPAA